ncbi:hypothetical protein H7Y63_00110 [Polaromonas sp.]|nr:hypothetical protein [Candidatus Saccharibacteria bacterium]
MHSTESTVPSKFSKIKSRKLYIAGAVVLVVLLIFGAIFVLRADQASKTLDGKASLQVVEDRVNKHFLLPSDEVPALATITDKSKLTTPFFKRAQNGDKILIYQKHKIAIMYRPSIDRVVEVGPVSLGNLGGQ